MLGPAKSLVTEDAVREAIARMRPLQVGLGTPEATETVAIGPGAWCRHE